LRADVHSRISGVTDHYAVDDRHALASPPHRRKSEFAQHVSLDVRSSCEPAYAAEEIYGDPPIRAPYDVRESLPDRHAANSTSSSSFMPDPGVGFARSGLPGWYLAITASCFRKRVEGTHFIELCTQLVSRWFSAEHHRFMVGRKYETRYRQGRRQDGHRVQPPCAEVHRDHRGSLRWQYACAPGV